ncbi:hypothetical protein [Spongiactinospora sp. TRM90649]|uniref:hypothetical protein n=1 Tax=Spongiactinospora sp. TRM90649 TaxID=3031114 RepID=UPI0023F7D76F|nr:hypothetical protein [Spongiactinospora sp. TRM90649]MDF5753385.1 hypothetical protein [Spongiactinospora sp. TRM90649]
MATVPVISTTLPPCRRRTVTSVVAPVVARLTISMCPVSGVVETSAGLPAPEPGATETITEPAS